ncbi:MAG: DUF2203 domain-containing protein [Myxococcales bacterium]|nr:DUF2203 domain-containing protein [Myxococcales bacterium]
MVIKRDAQLLEHQKERCMLSSWLMPGRYFTPQEANDLVPTIRAYFRKIREHGQVLLELEKRMAVVITDEDRHPLEREIARRESGQAHLLDRIDALGAQIIDPLEMGRVRFPALRNGEPVWLVWNLHETQVNQWTPMRSFVFGQRPVDQAKDVRWEWRN